MKRDTPHPHPMLVPGLFLSKSDVSRLLKPFCGCLGKTRINLYWLPWALYCLPQKQASDRRVTTWQSPDFTL